MTSPRLFVSSFAALSLLTVSACVTDPNTGHKRVSRAAIGAGAGTLGGLLLGGLIGGGVGRILGAGIGGITGAAIGTQQDKQIRALKEQTAGTGVDIASNGGDTILLDMPGGVTFNPGSDSLRPEAMSALDSIASNLRQYPNGLVDVYGYADVTEGSSNIQMLSDNRARAVANYLIMRGVSDARIRTRGLGATTPVAGSETEQGRSSNRRVEIKIVSISQEQVQAARQ